MAGPTMPLSGGVFISYRWQDTRPYARLLHEELSRRLGSQQVFMDVDSVGIGVDFAEAIEQALDACQVLLALIGPQWLTITDAEGQRRLDNLDDTVRLEIEAALARKVLVIPVLVENTPMPRKDQLPDSLKPLARREALEFSTSIHYKDDVGRLLDKVEKVVGHTVAPSPPPATPAPELPSRRGTQATDTETPVGGPTVTGGTVQHSVVQLLNQAINSRRLRRYDEALQDVNRALELDPNNAVTFRHRGMIYESMGRYEKALLNFDRALELNPNNAVTLICGARPTG